MSTELCFTCQRNPAERFIARYGFPVCRACWDANWNGWARQHEKRIVDHLRQHGLPVPVRNVWNLFPRE